MRIGNRAHNEIRPTKITTDYLVHPDGSVLIEVGHTKVICTASVEEKVPPFLRGTNKGWVTAEYGMLPGSTHFRKRRDASKGKIDGRATEIQRLIGRSLRSVIDLEALGERTIWIDCDVIQADGGTRTASITGAYVALSCAIFRLMERGLIQSNPIKKALAAVSVGIWEEHAILDLCYEEDSSATVDMNVVMTNLGEFIELQGTGEERPFSKDEMTSMLSLAEEGIETLYSIQKEALEKFKLKMIEAKTNKKTVVLASGNKHKLEEIQAILKDFDYNLMTMQEAGLVDYEIIEDGETFEENSYIKAKAVFDELGMITIADDSGLEVDYLDGAPGVYSARYSGEGANDQLNNAKLLSELKDVPEDQRTAKFVTVITMLFPNGEKIVSRGEVKGNIALQPSGENGFGYDPLFFIQEKGKTYAELTAGEKNQLSHRANALIELKKELER